MKKWMGLGSVLFCGLFISGSALANVIIGGTRVIYPESEKEVTVKLSNVGTVPVLIQSWLDNGNIDAKPDNIDVPFILSPPINRVEPNKGQTLRLSYTGTALPKDRESIFWLNVLEIPPTEKSAEKQNHLQVAFRSRIKVFFRPTGLTGDVITSAKSLTWTSSSSGLQASNHSPYYITVPSAAVIHGSSKKTADGKMIAPFSSEVFGSGKEFTASAGDKVNYEFINDWGAVKMLSSSIN